MPVLLPHEYNALYFEGKKQRYSHNAGYPDYGLMQYDTISANYGLSIDESTGTFYGDLIKGLNKKLDNQFIGKTVLVIGCAYGFEVESFRALGVNAFGIDVSPFAIHKAKPEIQQYLEIADIRKKIYTFSNNSFDFIFSRWFLECMSDEDLKILVPEMNRVCCSQCHIISSIFRKDYYNGKTLQEWMFVPFKKGTVLIENSDFDNYIRV